MALSGQDSAPGGGGSVDPSGPARLGAAGQQTPAGDPRRASGADDRADIGTDHHFT